MPYYDYRCADCKKPARLFFTFAEYDSAEPHCPTCESDNIHRYIRRVALAKSEESRMSGMEDVMSERALAAMEQDDPRELGRMMRKMSHEMGEDLGEEFGEVVDRLEKGQAPEDIEKAMPDLADDAGGGMGDMGGFDGF